MTNPSKFSIDNVANLLALAIGAAIVGLVGYGSYGFLVESRKSTRLEKVGASFAHLSSSTVSGIEIVRDGTSIRFKQPVGDDVVVELERDIRASQALDLDLADTQIGDRTISSLADAWNIKSLNLSNTHVTDRGLTDVATMRSLVQLSLDHCRITDAGLAQLTGLTELRILVLTGTQVTDEGLQQLTQLTGLRRIVVGWGAVTPQGCEELQSALPSAEVVRVGPPFDDPIEDVRVTEVSGKPIPGDGGPWVAICRAYFAALQERDAYTLKSLWSRQVEVSFKEISDDVLAIRPTSVERYRGFCTSDAATVSVIGPCREFGLVQYDVQFVLEDGEWRIAHLHWVIDAEPW